MAIEDVTEIVPQVATITPFEKLVLSIGEIPTNYLESMSYAEQVSWFCMFLQEQVLPVVNQHSQKILEIINYLNNLDLQDEVNNKLDEMTESGQLQEIIADYLNSKAIFGFDNVQAMKEATNLINGSYAKTLGYHTINDNGGATYKIRSITNEDIVDNFLIVPLSNDQLIAQLVINEYITPEMAGCYGDNSHDDTENLQKAINSGYPIQTKNQYKISNTLTILNSFIMDSASYIHLTSSITGIGVCIGNTTAQQFNKEYKVNVDCHGYSNIGLTTELIKRCNCKFNIKNAGTTGIKMHNTDMGGNNENQFNIHVFGNSSGTTTNGVIVNCYDSTFSDIIAIDCQNGVVLDHGQLFANSVHCWLSSDTLSTLWSNSTTLKCEGGYDCYINWLYQDTTKYGISGSNGFRGHIGQFECNCINDSTYYNDQVNVNFTGTVAITMEIDSFTNDKLPYHLLNYNLPTSKVNLFGVIGRNGPNAYLQEGNVHNTFTDANNAPQLGSKYVPYGTTNLPVSQNGILESEVKGNLVIQRYYSLNITNELA